MVTPSCEQLPAMIIMDITQGYAIAAGGVLFIPLIIHVFPRLSYLISIAPRRLCWILKYTKYLYLIRRHQFLGPWTPADVMIQLVYIGCNSFCLGFRASSLTMAGVRAGNLSLINLITLFLGPHLGFLADVLGISLNTFRQVHRSAGLMSLGLVIFHAIVIITSSTPFALLHVKNFSAVLGGSLLGLIVLLSWPPLRRRFYEIFLRLHQVLAATIAISTLLHVPSTIFPRLYFYTAVGIFTLTSIAEGGILMYDNRILTRGKEKMKPRVGEIFKYPGEHDGPTQLTILLKEPLHMKAGQYINICIPSLGFWSFMQSHPFVVTSWTGKKQTKLELVIEPRRGWTKKLHSRAITTGEQSGGLDRVLFTGPHGVPVLVDEYEYIIMVISGYGIVAHLPLLERLVQGTLAREVRARRICLVWECEDIGLYKAVFPLFNWVLIEDRKLGDNCALAISLYSEQLSPGALGHRAQISPGCIPLSTVFENETREIDNREALEKEAVRRMEEKRAEEKAAASTEISGIMKQPDREPISEDLGGLPVCTRMPRMLITVSATAKIRDEVRTVLRSFLDKEITLIELDYQPSD